MPASNSKALAASPSMSQRAGRRARHRAWLPAEHTFPIKADQPPRIRRKPMKTPSLLCMAAVLAALMAAPAAAQNVTLRSADIHPDGYPTVEAVIYMGKLVEERTKGRIKIQVFNNAALGSEKDTI